MLAHRNSKCREALRAPNQPLYPTEKCPVFGEGLRRFFRCLQYGLFDRGLDRIIAAAVVVGFSSPLSVTAACRTLLYTCSSSAVVSTAGGGGARRQLVSSSFPDPAVHVAQLQGVLTLLG